MDKGSWILFFASIMCSAASVFYGSKMNDEKEARILHIAGLILAILLILKNSF